MLTLAILATMLTFAIRYQVPLLKKNIMIIVMRRNRITLYRDEITKIKQTILF